MTTSTLLASLDWDDFLKSNSAVEAPIAFKDDPVAMTCASYRLSKEGGFAWLDLHAVTVEPEDREAAINIRKYYADRLLITTLKSTRPVSEFRRKLYGVVTDNYQLKKSEEGLLYRLPHFYAEDTGIDYVMSQTQSASMSTELPKIVAAKFTLVKKVFCSRAAGRSHWQYWFSSDISPAPFLTEIKDDNVLCRLFDTLTKQPQMFYAITHFKHHRGHHRDRVYFKMTQVDLV